MKSILRHSIGVYVEVVRPCSFSDNKNSDQCNIEYVVVEIPLYLSNP